MVSAIATKNLSARLAVLHTISGDASSAKDLDWVDMRDFDQILCTVQAVALTGNGVTQFSILANPQSNGGGTDVIVKQHAVGSAPDAVGDKLILEASAEEIRQLGETLRYVSINITTANSADSIIGTTIQSAGRFSHADLTADIVAA